MLRVAIVFLMAYASLTQAAAPVWKISHGDKQLYLAGTVHVLAQQDYPLPAAFDRAYQAASHLVFETDMGAMQGQGFQAELLQAMSYRDGRSLSSVLAPATYQALRQYAGSRGLDIAHMDGFKPSMVIMSLTLAELKRLGLGEIGVDAFFYGKARSDNKSTGQLESVAQQLDFIATLGEGREDEFVQYSLSDMESLGAMMRQLKQAWVRGDVATLNRIALLPLQQDFPSIYHSLIVQRNQAWMQSLQALLHSAPTELVLVGALHLVGEDGLLEQLAKKGYTVEALE
ncbi:TraB/GumN family protein [Dasania marina]|uniref:TraB/GumN family protein n=1 Tax=Dasania marina TaxID=471499 RepID=UPI0004B76408|nr:TraB/GumN family protein [Dasania marina]